MKNLVFILIAFSLFFVLSCSKKSANKVQNEDLKVYQIEDVKLVSFPLDSTKNGKPLDAEMFFNRVFDYCYIDNIETLIIPINRDRLAFYDINSQKEYHSIEILKDRDILNFSFVNKDSIFVSNIEYLCNYLPTTIRINIDIRNKDCFESLLKQLSKYKIANREVELFCKPIIPCWDCVKDSSMFDMISFFEIEKDFIKVAKEFGFKYSFHPNMRAGIRCPYYHINSFMIDAELYVYKCSLLVGEKNESIGRVTEDKQITICDVDKYYKAVNLSPINIEECKECSILPLCYGKCPILWKNSGHMHNEGCIPEKGTIIEKIKYLYNV